MTATPDVSWSLGSFLPLARMADEAQAARERYLSAKPYPHVVLDNFFDPALLDRVLSEFPQPNAIRWQTFDNEHEKKLASAAEASFGPTTRLLLYHLNSITFLEFLSRLTGIEHLIPDPSFEGGGLHQIERGGKLGVHSDFNKHGRYGLDRRLNVLVYLNKEWQEDYGGHLELWDSQMSRCEGRILPLFNRLMIFGTTDFTYHGHPDPLQCPADMTRKSLALYYFTNGRPASEVSGTHSTQFRGRNAAERRATLRQRFRALSAEVLPPVIARRMLKR